MSNSHSGSSFKRRHPRGNVESIRGALADTTHLIDSFKASILDMVETSKAIYGSVEELVRECQEERRSVGVGLKSIAQHIERQSTLPDDLARLHTLATDQSNKLMTANQPLQRIEQAVVTISTRLDKAEESSISTQATLAALAQSQVQISQTQAQILVVLRQLPPIAPAPAGPPNFYVSFPTFGSGSRKRRRLSESDDSEPAAEWEQAHVSAGKGDIMGGGRADGGQRNKSRTISDDSAAARVAKETRQPASSSDMSETMEGVGHEVQSSSPRERQPQDDEVDELVSSSSPTTDKLPTGPAATNWRSTTPTGQHVPSSSDDAVSFGRSSPLPASHLVSSTSHLLPPALLASRPPAADQRPSSSSEVLAPESSLDVGPSVRSTQERALPAIEGRNASPSLTPTVVGESSPPRVKVPLKRRTPRENRDEDDELTDLAASPTASIHSPPRSTATNTAATVATVATTTAGAAEHSSSPLSPVPMTSQKLLPSRNIADSKHPTEAGPASDASSDGPPLRRSVTVVADQTPPPRGPSPAAASPPQPKPSAASPLVPDPSMLSPSKPNLAPMTSPRSNTRLGPNPFARAMLQSPRALTSQGSPGSARSPPEPSDSNSLGSPIRLAHPGSASSPPPLPPPPAPPHPPARVVNPALTPAPPAAASVAGRVDDRRGRTLLPKNTPLDQGPSSEMSQSQDDLDGGGDVEMDDDSHSDRAEEATASHPPSDIPTAMSDAIDAVGIFKLSALDNQPSSSDDEVVTDPRKAKAKHKTKSGESSRTVTPRKKAQSTPVRGSSSMTPENANRKLLSLPTLGRHATHHPSSGGSGSRSRSASASMTPVRAGRAKKGKRMLLFDDVDAEGESDDAEGEVEEVSDADGMGATGMGTGEGSRARSLERVEMSAELEDEEIEGMEMEMGTQRAEEALYGALKEDEGEGLAGSWEA